MMYKDIYIESWTYYLVRILDKAWKLKQRGTLNWQYWKTTIYWQPEPVFMMIYNDFKHVLFMNSGLKLPMSQWRNVPIKFRKLVDSYRGSSLQPSFASVDMSPRNRARGLIRLQTEQPAFEREQPHLKSWLSQLLVLRTEAQIHKTIFIFKLRKSVGGKL